jgi:hypothetical protein
MRFASMAYQVRLILREFNMFLTIYDMVMVTSLWSSYFAPALYALQVNSLFICCNATIHSLCSPLLPSSL